MTEYEVKAECEKRFQNGGPRVYYFYPDKNEFFGIQGSGKRAAECADNGSQVWQRRKVFGERRYHWVCIHTQRSTA